MRSRVSSRSLIPIIPAIACHLKRSNGSASATEEAGLDEAVAPPNVGAARVTAIGDVLEALARVRRTGGD